MHPKEELEDLGLEVEELGYYASGSQRRSRRSLRQRADELHQLRPITDVLRQRVRCDLPVPDLGPEHGAELRLPVTIIYEAAADV